MIEKVTSGTYRHEADTDWGTQVRQIEDREKDAPTGFVTVVRHGFVSPDVPDYLIAEDENHAGVFHWNPLTQISSELAIVLESDRLAANARIAELEAQVAGLRQTLALRDARIFELGTKVSDTAVYKSRAENAERREDALRAQVAEMQPVVEAVKGIEAALRVPDMPHINAWAGENDDAITIKFGNMFKHEMVQAPDLQNALIALAKVS